MVLYDHEILNIGHDEECLMFHYDDSDVDEYSYYRHSYHLHHSVLH